MADVIECPLSKEDAEVEGYASESSRRLQEDVGDTLVTLEARTE